MAKGTGVKLTERDIEILKFINDFGFCEMPQLDRRFDLKKPRNYQIINRLVEGGLIHHERVFYGRHGIYRLTNKGARLTDLPPLSRIPLATYTHDITLIEVYLKLRKHHPEAQWISERQLTRDKHADGVGKRGHLSDGILVFPEGKQVAIEVELSLKSKYRLERILKGYGAQFSIKEVRYYCPENIAAYIGSLATKMPFIQVHSLREFLAS